MRKGLPENFLERCESIFGRANFDKIKTTFRERPTTFRVNTIKAKKEEILEKLQQTGLKVRRVPWYADAFILEKGSQRELLKLEMYEKGQIYLQSLASMVPVLILDPRPGERVLDLTAAPGSKTGQMAAIMKLEGELVANEVNPIRFEKLVHNMQLLGVEDKNFLRLLNEDGVGLYEKYSEYFDKVLLDAPCGAEARFNEKEIRSFAFWNERKIKEHAHLQRKLLFSAWSALRSGGTLVYSTCTFAPEENEAQVNWLLEKFPNEAVVEKINVANLETVPVATQWKGEKYRQQIKNCLRIMPTGFVEGFFVAKIKKI
ncbi:MAG: RsmB/NOP family class I SAM-dependent RNA methyltransferase [bacterium]|nr:RsmB/NOP family class I SAM-dependent RNA methyltransferase [bacterium]